MGSQKLSDMLRYILTRRLAREQLGVVQDLGNTMIATSICGLGQVVANPILSVMKHFPEDLAKYF
jgi:NADH:ubiquinone oxidoreductase subunit F (NADH-binding)